MLIGYAAGLSLDESEDERSLLLTETSVIGGSERLAPPILEPAGSEEAVDGETH